MNLEDFWRSINGVNLVDQAGASCLAHCGKQTQQCLPVSDQDVGLDHFVRDRRDGEGKWDLTTAAD